MAELNSNADAVAEAESVQQQTKSALYRIQQQAAQTEELGNDTLEEMRDQRRQMQRVQLDAEDLHDELNRTQNLQNRFDRWAGNWRGRHKRVAKSRAKEHLAHEKRDRERSKLSGEKENVYNTLSSATTSQLNKSNQSNATSSESKKEKKSKALTKVKTRPPKAPLVNPQEAQKLDADSREGLAKLESNNAEIDVLLDQTADSLDRLMDLSKAMKEETQTGNANIDKLTDTMDKASQKQAVINVRARRHLVGRWRKNSDKTE